MTKRINRLSKDHNKNLQRNEEICPLPITAGIKILLTFLPICQLFLMFDVFHLEPLSK